MDFTEKENQLLLQAVQKYGFNFGKMRHLLPGRSKTELAGQFKLLQQRGLKSVRPLETKGKFNMKTGRKQRTAAPELQEVVYFSPERLEALVRFVSYFDL